MAEVGGMLAYAMLKVVTQQIGSIVGGQLKLQWDFSDDLRKMKMTLDSMEAVLQDAERRSIQDAAVRLWLKRLTDAMYGISDILGEFETTAEPPGWKIAARMPYLAVGSKILIANKMKKMRQEVENIKDQHQQFSFKTDSKSNVQPVPDERETDSYMEDQTLVVGRTEEKRKILSCLSEGIAQDITILPIYGIGGIGKTTLAKLVFNDTYFKDHSKVWIYVSQMLNVNKIGNSIISQLSKEESNLTERQMIRNHLGQLLTDPNYNKKIMIVLDDVWEENDSQLNELKTMLPVIKGGKVVVIVTTRDEHIARKICTVQPYKLLPLSDETCWAIIKRKSDFEARDDKEHLEQVGRDIAMKCGGVALAAQALGYMLKPLTFGEWESVRNSDIWNASTSEQESLAHHNVLACLLLSYRSMPPPLKLCFAYCAFFPKGYKLDKNDLIYQWIAHGFIAPSSIFSTRQLGEKYAKQLLGMSFLQHSKSSSIQLHSRTETTS
ncbi:putative disease resistance protein RGA3 isoform X4 [Panicum hallii]|uniref:putative disease resistance protein RGA3 isoform X4 n=1 Tax=Panicum hallii TaxID=206008 RepID=UPI000DF4EBFA|nr:putative disease resistance protein RGA3 isoform X4 [Panicum hallii]